MLNAGHRLWLWFWHLVPANPILVRVVAGASRRVRHLWLRAGYLVVLFAVVVGNLTYVMSEGSSLAELAKGASKTFEWASTAQLLLMSFLAPVFTASAITQEKDAQTFNILVSTPLSNGQIVLGSLMSRLYFVIMLLLAGLPIFLTTMVYGGVTGRQIVESFALAGATAILTGALAIFVAMLGVGTRRTIFSFYLLIALYLLSFYLLGLWSATWVDAAPANISGRKMSWLAPLHPFLALDVSLNRVQAPDMGELTGYGAIGRWALSAPSAAFILWTLTTALVLVLVSVVFVRRGAKIGEPTLWSKLPLWLRRRRGEDRCRPPRTVWNNPVAWREAKTRAAGGALLKWLVLAAGLAASMAVFVLYVQETLSSSVVANWLAALTIIQFAIALLIATNTAATSMTKEREARTMDLLLTTPLTSRYILWGKLRGLVSFAAPLLVCPVIVLLVFAAFDALRAAATPTVWLEVGIELAILLLVATALACVVALQRSLKSRTNMIAVMSSVGINLLMFGAVTMLFFAIIEGSGQEFGAFMAAFTPFTAAWYLVNPIELFDNSAKELAANARPTHVAGIVGSVIATAIYSTVVWRFYAGLVRDFDMTIRKQSSQ